METIMAMKEEQAAERREAWEREKDLIFPDRVALRNRLNAPKKDTEKDLLARVGALEKRLEATPVRPVVSAPLRPAAPAAPQLRRMSAAELARGIAAVENDIETQAWARARRRVAGETG